MLLLLGPTIDEDKELLEATQNPILIELRREKTKKTNVQEKSNFDCKLEELKLSSDNLRKKRFVSLSWFYSLLIRRHDEISVETTSLLEICLLIVNTTPWRQVYVSTLVSLLSCAIRVCMLDVDVSRLDATRYLVWPNDYVILPTNQRCPSSMTSSVPLILSKQSGSVLLIPISWDLLFQVKYLVPSLSLRVSLSIIYFLKVEPVCWLSFAHHIRWTRVQFPAGRLN